MARTPEQLVQQYDFGKVSAEVLDLFNKISSINISIQQASSQMQDLMSSLNTVENGIKTVENNLGTVENGLETLSAQVTNLNNAVEKLKSVNTVQSWLGTETPTLENTPAIDWTESEIDSHIGDIYFDTVTKKMYIFNKTGEGVYIWVECVNTLPTDITEGGEDETNA